MIHNILAIFGTRLLVSLGNLLLTLALARCMGPERQGVVNFQVMLFGLLVLGGSLGLDAAAVYYLNRIGVTARAYLRRVLPMLVPAVLGAALLVMVLVHFGLLGSEGTRSPLLMLITLLVFPLELTVSLVRCLLMARERIGEYNSVELVQSLVLYVLVGTMLVLRPDSPAWVLGMYLLDRLVVVLLILRRLRARPLDPPDAVHKAAPPLGEILSYSIFPWLANVFSMLNVRLDTLMVAWYVSRVPTVRPADLGLYTVTMLAVARLQDVQMAIQTAYFPRVTSLPRADATRLACRFYRISTPVYLLLFLVMLAAGWPALRLFGEDYVRAYPTLVALSFGVMALRANSGILSIYFTAQGRQHLPPLVNGAGVVVNVILNLWLIPRYGILGAALGTIGACGLTKGLLVFAILREGASYRRDLCVTVSDVREAWQVFCKQAATHWLNPWRKAEDA